ncbi:HD domain-containing protein [Bacillus sp. TL12]|uniref:HD domain-containing protein n=1 Tax=Bacillus sp. TL12 TaxID=2894756 RepID=UPI001F517410|nr:HD domain-containing protein [Bacillus sp. TL12]MCI0764977.1 HD domain-containing protein [Bacillus sp. TL12]
MKFTDPIYKAIHIQDTEILDLINTNAFRRLSSIKQQGNTYFLHPSAVHTRFGHSLGVYELMNKVISHLTSIGDIRISEHDTKVATVAALLHDIGHGPFSHCFQKISGEDHGEWTIKIIEEDEQIRSILNRIPNLLEDVVKVLKGEGEFQVIEEIMYSWLGIDQLDYWNRDLYYSSLQLKPISIDNLILTLRFVDDRLVMEEEGIPYIEHLVKVKKNLYDTGFGHPFVVGKDLLLREIFRIMQEKKIPFVISDLKVFFNKQEGERLLTDFLVLNDETIYNEIKTLSMNKETEAAALAHLYLSSSSSLQWMEGKPFNAKMNREDVSILDVIIEKKNYSSYTGGIFVKKDDGLHDIMHSSNYIREIARLPLKEHTYFLEKSGLIIKK